jgi:transcriptional regulator with XRE-family HTH domain
MTIGERLKQVRQKAGLKQKEMAALFGLKMPGYNRIERDKVKLTLDHLITLKKKFGISLDWLITGETEKSEIDSFGGFVDTVKNMLTDMEKDEGLFHAMLSHYHHQKERKSSGKGNLKKTQEV